MSVFVAVVLLMMLHGHGMGQQQQQQQQQQPSFPTWSNRYEARATMEVPQWAEVGLEGVGTQEIRVWFDGVRKRERVEYGSGKDMLVNVVVPGKLFGYHSHWSYVKDTRRVCEASLIDNLLGLSYVFPQHTTGWSYAGQEQYENRSCNVWTRSPPHGGAANNFTFYADAKTGGPVAYIYAGSSGSLAGYLHSPNYDWFVIRYTSYTANFYNASMFEPLCESTVKRRTKQGGGFDAKLFLADMAADGPHRIYQPRSVSMADLPSEVDWVSKGVVFGIKDQADCGSCWAFGSAAAIESAHAIKHGILAPLSEQVLLDCSWPYGNNACNGGSQSSAYKAIIQRFNGSWPLETEYAYRQNPGTCQNIEATKSNVKLLDYHYVIGTHALMDAVANHGPVAVAISTFPANPFTYYHTGVFADLLCNPIIPDHVVSVVGYGTDNKTGVPYWRLKNQWSSFWGEQGFMRITRRLDDCGVATYGVLPIVA